MAEKFTEKRSGDDRRKATRRGAGPELSIEQLLDEKAKPAEDAIMTGPDNRSRSRRVVIQREEDRELHNFLADVGSG